MTPLWRAARLALGTTAALGFARFSYGLLVPAMRASLGWNLAQAGGLTTANGLGYLLGALAAAPVARRLGETAAFRVGMGLVVAALAATAATGAYPVLLLTRALAGTSGALVFITGGVIASRIAGATGSAAPVAIYFAGPGLGIALAGAVLPPVLGRAPGLWQGAWLGLAAAAAVAMLVSWGAARGRARAHSPAATVDLAGVRRLWPVATAFLLFGAGYIAYITFLSAYLVAQHAGIWQISVTWVLLGLATLAAPAVWSRPIASWPGARALAVLLALLAAAALIALASTSPGAVVLSAVIYGITFLSVPAAVTGHIRAAIPPAGWTGVLAALTVAFATGQMSGPYLAGLLADRYGAGAVLVWTAALCLAGAALAATVRGRSGGRGAPAPEAGAPEPAGQ